MPLKHSFHIPVMGIGYTIDTPIKVAHLGIDSSISLVDDILIEKMREFYCKQFELPYQEISQKVKDYRAKRITSYLDMMHDIASDKLEGLRRSFVDKKQEFQEFLDTLPNGQALLEDFKVRYANGKNLSDLQEWVKENITLGAIDVNIMTKVDRTTYRDGEAQSAEFNDAHAALRGFANSKLSSSVILSAGMNTRLYAYMEKFKDFFPNQDGEFKKKIILKVSDFKSALVQGKFLAKKGLWVSEYRIESGLNCGGHAFAKEGFLMGPILNEFKTKREDLFMSVREVLDKALASSNRIVPQGPLVSKITAQGGVGTSDEHHFLMKEFKVDSVGWGSPFMLVPEVTSVDDTTRKALLKAKEEDLYLSKISPLGVPFNSLKGNTKDQEKLDWIQQGKPGSPCPKEFVKLNTEFSDRGLCTASRLYQKRKIEELKQTVTNKQEFQVAYQNIIEKSCVCVGLGTSAMIDKSIETNGIGDGVSVCPGPNIAYYSKESSLKEMLQHIYGSKEIPVREDRPNMFIKELNINIDFLKDRIAETHTSLKDKANAKWQKFADNINDGIAFYHEMVDAGKGVVEDRKEEFIRQLNQSRKRLTDLFE